MTISWRRVPRRAVLRFLILLAILLVGFVAVRYTPLREFLTKENIVAFFADLRLAWWSPIALVLLYLLVSPSGLPVSPLVFAGGVVFGIWWGWLYNFVGSMLGASLSYLLARALGRELVVHIAGKALVERVEKILERHGFWTLVRVRFLPIPFAVINFGAALTGIRWPVFLSTSVLGLAPSMVIWTYFGHAIFSVASEDRRTVVLNLVAAIALALVLTFLIPLRNTWRRRRYGGQ